MIQIDMEMPDSCRECWFLNYDMYSGRTSCAIEDMTLAQYFKALDFEGRHEECPMIDVPDTNVGDMISRQAAIDAVKGAVIKDEQQYAEDALKALPSAQPEQQWVPCREELPKENGVYLVYAPSYTGGSSSAKENYNGIMFSNYKNGKWSIEWGYYRRPDCVIAWMHLPEPWEGEQDETT